MFTPVAVDGAPLGTDTGRARRLRLILGDQLNHHHSWFDAKDDTTLYVMMEVRSETDVVRHHVQKIIAVFAAMRRFAYHLREHGHRVCYIGIHDENNRQVFTDNLAMLLDSTGATEVEIQEPEDFRLRQVFAQSTLHAAWASGAMRPNSRTGRTPLVRFVPTEHFLVDRHQVDRYLPPGKRAVMEFFYRTVRKERRWLIEADGSPTGGAWNFDADNRKRWRGGAKDPLVPEPPGFATDLSDVFRDIVQSGIDWFGTPRSERFPWPVTRAAALEALDHFAASLLPHFGTYQDAISSSEPFLFHSRLSFVLNVKLLSPVEVIERSLAEWKRRGGAIGINQVEGFIRQIAGWREYMRLMYWRLMPGLAGANHLGATGALPAWYWTGETRMACMRSAITTSLEYAYAHHIQRLMITGNFALIAGVDPSAVDAWYAGIYIDAFDWVEKPNTLGMSQFAEGGAIATKPYAASAAYINRQGDHCKECTYNAKSRTDADSCPFNALYWDFYLRNEAFRGNRRINFVYPALDRMGEDERTAIRTRAMWLRERIDSL